MNILDLFFPKKCFFCRKEGGYYCKNCIAALTPIPLRCPVCEKKAIDGFTHPRCASSYSLDRLITLWPYKGGLRDSIISLKYRFAYDVAFELANTIVNECNIRSVKFPKNSVMVPIPLHPKRQRWRGFNHVEIVGKSVSDQLGMQFTPDLLTRKKHKAPQVELSRSDRKRSIQGVFDVDPMKIEKNKTFVIFDDVYTTGSTLGEAARVLKKNGALVVWGLTIVR